MKAISKLLDCQDQRMQTCKKERKKHFQTKTHVYPRSDCILTRDYLFASSLKSNFGLLFEWPLKTGFTVIQMRLQSTLYFVLQIVNSMPPVWGQKAPYGSLGTFYGTDQINVVLTAIVSNDHYIGATAIVLVIVFYSTLTLFSTKYLVMCKVNTDVGDIKWIYHVCPPVRKIIHSLKLVDYFHVQADNPWYNYYVYRSINRGHNGSVTRHLL